MAIGNYPLCKECGTTNGIDEWPTQRHNGDTYFLSWCRSCHRARERARYHATRAHQSDARHLSYLWKRYGITVEQKNAMIAAQDGVCAICRTTEPGGKGWHIDHDHKCCPNRHGRTCGKCIRGILCHGCNVSLGLVKDRVEVLQGMIQYLSADRTVGV